MRNLTKLGKPVIAAAVSILVATPVAAHDGPVFVEETKSSPVPYIGAGIAVLLVVAIIGLVTLRKNKADGGKTTTQDSTDEAAAETGNPTGDGDKN